MTAIERRPRFQYDEGFQEKILRVLYQDEIFASMVGSCLSSQHFSKRSARWVAHKILAYAVKYNHGISVDALRNYLRKDLKEKKVQESHRRDIEFLITKLELTVPDKSYIKEELSSFIEYQTYRETTMQTMEYLQNGEQDKVRDLYHHAIEVRYTLTDGDIGKFYLKSAGDRAAARKAYVKNGISCGLLLDSYLKPGGLSPGKLGVIVAPTGRGKSHALVHFGKTALLAGKRVLHVTLGDLDIEDIADRYDASMTGFKIDELEAKSDEIEGVLHSTLDAIGDNLLIKYFPSITLTASMLRAYLRRLERQAFYPDLIVIDYADEMLPNTKNDSVYESQGNVYRELRNLAKDHHCAIWTASQTTRSALKSQDLDLDVLADSFKKAMIADLMVFFCQTPKEKRACRARLFVGKNRLGLDKFFFNINVDTSRSLIYWTDTNITLLSADNSDKVDSLLEEIDNEKVAA